MALLHRKAFLQSLTPFIQCKRFRGKVNIQRPKPPHFEKAKYLALTQPWFINPNKNKPLVELCRLNRKLEKKKDFNPLRDIYAKELYNSFKNSKLIVFYHFNSMKADENFRNYALFKKQGMELKKFEREMLSAAVSGTPYETVLDFYVTSNNMILFCPEPEVNKVLKISKKCPQLIMLAGILENTLINKDDLIKYSKIPNLQIAQAELVQTVNRVGSQLVSDLNSHQSSLVSNLEQRMKQLEMEDK
ncbi:39S ribosomal protein L10, mitochondrial [Diorhabda sublineata]|uniref:39S ribosomal protein L10, mitochondrial n=1 Tax=Diorhabda sublineata TaxID=1163346 RepID=UPI0024E12D9B|nr:39S ribosomal protein L10, mitochondrial [Diorhabda sublineata]